MIITGELPDFLAWEDLSDVFRDVAEIALQSVQTNFFMGGRPRGWANIKRDGPSHLIKTGALLNSLYSDSGKDWARVSTDNIPYAWRHQEGWGTTPARPYMVLQESDIEQICDFVGNHMVEYVTTKGKVIRLG